MAEITIEPSWLVLAGGRDAGDRASKLRRFASGLEWLASFLTLNGASFPFSREMYDAVQRLFPWEVLASGGREWATLTRRALLIADRHAVRPMAEWEGREDTITLGRGWIATNPPYDDDELWMAWRDLLAAAVARERGEESTPLLVVDAGRSCVEPGAGEALVETGDGSPRRYRCVREALGGRFLCPGAYRDLMARVDPTVGPDLIWEKGVKDAVPREIRKVLVRTAKRAGGTVGLVRRMATTYRNDGATDTCKLGLDADVSRLLFRASAGGKVVKGYFTTVASSEREQRVALALVEREFVAQCRRERLVIEGAPR